MELAGDADNRSRVVYTLAGIGPTAPDAVAFLVDVVQKGRGFDRENAIEALGRGGPAAAAAVPVLRERLRALWNRPEMSGQPGWNYQQTIDAVGNIGPAAKDAVPELRQALKHAHKYIREAAAAALGRIEGSSARED
jgi:HEAT repeat protein